MGNAGGAGFELVHGILERGAFGGGEIAEQLGFGREHQGHDLAIDGEAFGSEIENGAATVVGSMRRVIWPFAVSLATARLTRTLSIAVRSTTLLADIAP